MIVCSCNVLSADAIRACSVDRGALLCTPAAVYREFGCRARCGRCARTIRSILTETGAAEGCRRRGCGAAAVSAAADWMTQGTLARIPVKPVVDLDQGRRAAGG